ncbi:hypothetical protein [Eubacterium callanderi]|uniref:hypothetical protein n=1 Tax=Eubacterium callanderi TaxID=53442 RepID=UPI001C107824|nr:hypothetical protein [Eubacterium callanderi]MBU5304845.1 hypothetical protein [Eubacterium callanderi]WPK68988.1 hypothetical protein EUCA2A_31630 [Eubacterium callanderi]WPK73286.1 hypothetical protein EUCA11A_31630 [Eubacterium callanderi]
MNKYIRGLVVIPHGFLKTFALKVIHHSVFSRVSACQISTFTEIRMDNNVSIKLRNGATVDN